MVRNYITETYYGIILRTDTGLNYDTELWYGIILRNCIMEGYHGIILWNHITEFIMELDYRLILQNRFEDLYHGITLGNYTTQLYHRIILRHHVT